MSLRGRLRRLEGRAPDSFSSCPGCGRSIVVVDRRGGGEPSYPSGEPCASCEGPDSGAVFLVMKWESDGAEGTGTQGREVAP